MIILIVVMYIMIFLYRKLMEYFYVIIISNKDVTYILHPESIHFNFTQSNC
jgi:hypothetical protein